MRCTRRRSHLSCRTMSRLRRVRWSSRSRSGFRPPRARALRQGCWRRGRGGADRHHGGARRTRAAGCSRVFISDLSQEKLAIAGRYQGIMPVHVPTHTLDAVVGKVDLKPLLTNTFPFKDSIRAFEQAASGLPSIVKVQITLPDEPH
jgi:hypothetical protein